MRRLSSRTYRLHVRMRERMHCAPKVPAPQYWHWRLREKAVSAARIRDLFAKLRIWFREDAPRIILHVSQLLQLLQRYTFIFMAGRVPPTSVVCSYFMSHGFHRVAADDAI